MLARRYPPCFAAMPRSMPGLLLAYDALPALPRFALYDTLDCLIFIRFATQMMPPFRTCHAAP